MLHLGVAGIFILGGIIIGNNKQFVSFIVGLVKILGNNYSA